MKWDSTSRWHVYISHAIEWWLVVRQISVWLLSSKMGLESGFYLLWHLGSARFGLGHRWTSLFPYFYYKHFTNVQKLSKTSPCSKVLYILSQEWKTKMPTNAFTWNLHIHVPVRMNFSLTSHLANIKVPAKHMTLQQFPKWYTPARARSNIKKRSCISLQDMTCTDVQLTAQLGKPGWVRKNMHHTCSSLLIKTLGQKCHGHSGIGRQLLLYSWMHLWSGGIKAQSDNSGVSTRLRGCQSGPEAGRSPI